MDGSQKRPCLNWVKCQLPREVLNVQLIGNGVEDLSQSPPHRPSKSVGDGVDEERTKETPKPPTRHSSGSRPVVSPLHSTRHEHSTSILFTASRVEASPAQPKSLADIGVEGRRDSALDLNSEILMAAGGLPPVRWLRQFFPLLNRALLHRKQRRVLSRMTSLMCP